MRTPKVVLLVLAFSAWLVGAGRPGTPEDKVMAEALKPSSLQQNLRVLTDEIGGRIPGTPAMDKAIDWGVAAFKAAGADSVTVEKYQIPASWAEGATSVVVTSPSSFRVRAISIAWTPALPATHARFLDVGNGSKQDFDKAGDVSGAVVLVHSEVMKQWKDLFDEYLRAPAVLKLAVERKVLAVAFMSTREHDLLYRHTNALDGHIEGPSQLLLAREDALRIARLLAAGQTVEADLAIPNRTGGPFEAANVIAELRGSEKPDQWVLVGAHLDSWELGTGALDNGCNAAMTIDALRAIKATGLRPKRSIRFALFTGEEQGMLGSHAYTRMHRNELDNAMAVIVFDSGTGKTTGFSDGGRPEVAAALAKLAAPLARFQADRFTDDGSIGTDNWDFLLEGVPNLTANEQEANYLVNYHAESDTYDKVDQKNLKDEVAMASVLAYAIADAPARLAPRQTRAQIAETLHKTGLDDEMKTFGLWSKWESEDLGREK